KYDALSQLSGIAYALPTGEVNTLTYAYDPDGRRIGVGGTLARTGLPAAMAEAEYDAADQVIQWNGVQFAYDGNGNLSSDGLSTYSWDARNQLVSITGSVSATFDYDAFGRRAAKVVNGATQEFLYDGANFVQEKSAGGLVTADVLAG